MAVVDQHDLSLGPVRHAQDEEHCGRGVPGVRADFTYPALFTTPSRRGGPSSTRRLTGLAARLTRIANMDGVPADGDGG
jgi:hypothetical protein